MAVAPTDASGHARTTLPLRAGRYLLSAVGRRRRARLRRGHADLSVRAPLALRVDVPPRLALGDRAELAIVLDNDTAVPVAVVVGARAAGAEVAPARRVSVPPAARSEVRLALTAARPG